MRSSLATIPLAERRSTPPSPRSRGRFAHSSRPTSVDGTRCHGFSVDGPRHGLVNPPCPSPSYGPTANSNTYLCCV
ncbi:hypothetical protein VTJ04DRAFT_3745 [Mycothermus thermophilus]|uniref:uncharacterized protein n=1 Tax=Humicola insolens TaxID=85995 RepID=UPI0037443736